MVKDLLCDEFQNTVAELLIRHQSILDILTKFQETTARVNRAVAKAVTSCGCVQIITEKTLLPEDVTVEQLKSLLNSNFYGSLCPDCREIVESEMGKTLFYMAAMCNAIDINLYDVLVKEQKKIATLRIFNFT